jgi:hypothetical protein
MRLPVLCSCSCLVLALACAAPPTGVPRVATRETPNASSSKASSASATPRPSEPLLPIAPPQPPEQPRLEDRSPACLAERKRLADYVAERAHALVCATDGDCKGRIAADLCNADCNVYANPKTASFAKLRAAALANPSVCSDGLCRLTYSSCAQTLVPGHGECREHRCVSIGLDPYAECGSPSPREIQLQD